MNQPLSFYFYLFILFIDIIIGISFYKKLDNASQVIVFLLMASFLNEVISLYYSNFYNKKSPIDDIYSIIEIVLISLYFLKTIKPAKYILFFSIFIIGWSIIGSLNLIFLQPLNILSSNFLMIESIATIAMSLYAIYKILIDDAITNVFKNINFCIWFLFLFYSSSTFFFWALFNTLVKHHSPYRHSLLNINVCVNIIFYIGIAITFLFSPKATSK